MEDAAVETQQQERGTKKKTRIQLQLLEESYSEDKHPDQKEMAECAAALNLTYNQVRKWFSDRRRKEKNENGRYTPNRRSPRVSRASTLNGGGVEKASVGHGGKKAHATYISKVVDKEKYSFDEEIIDQTDTEGNESPGPMKNYSALPIGGGRRGMKHRGSPLKQQVNKCAGRIRRLLQKKPPVRLQVLFAKDYILKKVFRKDGPPLGVEFDCLPAKRFDYRSGFDNCPRSSHHSQRIAKKRKACESSILDMQAFCGRYAPAKKYGVGKGLMTVWHATKPNSRCFPSGINFMDASMSHMCSNDIPNKKLHCVSERLRNQELFMRQKLMRNSSRVRKNMTSMRKSKMSCNKDAGLKMPFMAECKLAIDDLRSQMQSDSPNLLIDDEELELSELQTGSSPPRCSAHLASKGTNGCPLCKDMLARFPPPSVRMKQPICAKPWDSSSEIAKKFFKVLRFLYAHAMVIDTCPFTLDALAQAFHDKDSMLLGKIHVALLRLLLLDIERELSAEISPRASKDCRFLGFIHAIRQQELDFNFWIQSLNPLTWVEILRQVLISAGFATKKNSMRRTQTKEGNAMAKYGLRPRTLKGELYKILFERASSGSKVAELAKASQIIALDLCTSPTELELLISSALSSDCTLFEKIGPFAYRLRVSSTIMKGINDSLSDTDSGSAEDDSGESNSSSSSDESYSSELDSAASKQSIVRFKRCQKRKSKKLCQSAEIDESFSGEAWLLGLMEGEYSDLSIEEKLDALVALVDLTNSCASLRVEEPVRDMLALIPDKRYCGSGGKLKKALLGQDTSVIPFGLNSSRDCPVDSSSDGSKSSYKGHLSGNRKEYFGPTDVARATNSVAEESGCGMHTLQSIQLGSDRRYNSYWLFLGPCSASDPGHRRVYFESSEDGHWEVIDTEQALSALLSVLDGRGARESHLLSSLKKREPYLCQAMSDFMVNEIGCGQRNMCHLPDTDITSGNSSSPLSDVDNNPVSETIDDSLVSGAVVLEFGKNMEEKKHKWDRLQQFDKWVWASFYCNLNAVKVGNKAYIESLVRCESCHDLYWRDEKHCRICHTTFELDFDLEERYAIHVATCRQMVDAGKFPSHRVLSSQLQALKASIHAVEACMPEDALVDAWTKSAHKLWVKRLRRTSSMPELFQVIGDFVGAIREGWMYECSLSLPCNTALDDIAVLFQTMPQTTSAVALWLVKLDSLIAPHLQRLQSQTTMGATQVKRRRACA